VLTCVNLRKIFSLIALLLISAGVARADWRADLSPPGAGAFPSMRDVKLSYECGWAGIKAGEVVAQFTHPKPDECVMTGSATTTGLARMLWRIDATHEAHGNPLTLKPRSVRQVEVYHYQTISTALDYDDDGVARLRASTADKNPARRKRFEFPGLHDLQTALLYVRSQPLKNGDVYHLVVYPGTAAYLATVTVEGRDRIKVKAGEYPAIRMDLKLEKIQPDMTLVPHGKFKRATAWLSDDSDRLPLRMNAQIFIGSVWVELAKVE
jgi:hypothetical protein